MTINKSDKNINQSHHTKPNAQATPVIAQYLDIKKNHQDCLVFFQMGDFYELFFEDAQIAATELDIVLTYRGKYEDADIPMCGVPVHNYASYSEKLVQRGYKIAVCAQTETPQEAKKRGYKAIVNRQIVRIVTAGTLTEAHLLDARRDNFLCALSTNQTEFCCFFYDISTGKTHFFIDKINLLSTLIQHKKPSEIIYSDSETKILISQISVPQTHQPLPEAGLISEQLLPNLQEFSASMTPLAQQALGILSTYLKRTQCRDDVLLQAPEQQFYDHFLYLDQAAQANLEIFKTLSGDKKPTVFSVLDCCKTAAGARLLAEYLNFPVTQRDVLNSRYDAIDFFYQHTSLGQDLQLILKKTADLNRILGRVKTERATPADLGQIRDTLDIIYTEFPALKLDIYTHIPTLIINNYNDLCTPLNIYPTLKSALQENVPVALKIGNFIAQGYDSLLDKYKDLRENARHYILELEQKYKDITQISALKIKHNNVIGYHIDVSSNHSEKMLTQKFSDVEFIHKQTLANHVRFTTQELIGLEKKISEASLYFDQREKEIFKDICQNIDAEMQVLIRFSQAIAALDLYASHGIFAHENGYTRPEIVQEKTLKITQGRHCVVEHLLKKEAKKFIANDTSFKEGDKNAEIWLVTGPNMGGKSTYLRQNALMIIMAQAGFFVPAQQYRAGIFDKIFSRIGASDNLAEGKSTFMSEMSETAEILTHATSHSFVILDELGRGTSTYDGLAIAYATLKYLSQTIGALGLFATHYHELTQMIAHHKRIGNLQVTVTHHKKEIIFLHKISQGAAQQSYGVHVAELAGMPLEVLHEATNFLKSISKQKTSKIKMADTAPLLQQMDPQAEAPPTPDMPIATTHPVLETLNALDLNTLSPMQAFELIQKLQNMLQNMIVKNESV